MGGGGGGRYEAGAALTTGMGAGTATGTGAAATGTGSAAASGSGAWSPSAKARATRQARVTKVWKEGPSLLQERDSFGCGRIQLSKNSSGFSIIVAGGYNGATFLRTTEVLDQSMQEWKQGPVFPFGICRNRIVEDADGGVVMVGGWVSGGQLHLDTLFRLPHAGQDGKWEELPQKLKIGRWFQIALMLPDHLANCN